MKIRAFIIPESTDIKSGGDAESAPVPVSGLNVKIKNGDVTFFAPTAVGSYRLFVFAYDKKGGYGYENIPFKVNAPSDNSRTKRPVAFKHYEMTAQ
jgi:hypothetical protein